MKACSFETPPLLASFHLVICAIILCCGASRVEAAKTNLLELYKDFLSSGATNGAIIFKREIATPLPPGVREPGVGLATFIWNGPKFVVAYSTLSASNIPALDESLGTAETLCGFDGTNFWRLRPKSIRIFDDNRAQPTMGTPVNSYSYLTVVSAEDMAASQGKFDANPTLTTISEFENECRRVAQFGFSYSIDRAPTPINDRIWSISSKDKGSQLIEIVGLLEHPDSLTYTTSENHLPKIRVIPHFELNSLAIERLSSVNLQPVSSCNYTLEQVRSSMESLDESVFSWQHHATEPAELVVEILKDGATVPAQIYADGSIRASEEIPILARPIESKTATNPSLDSDAHFAAQLTGVWEFAATNDGKWISTFTEYKPDGLFEMIGTVGESKSGVLDKIGDSGLWRIDHGYLNTVATNASSGRINRETSYRIVSVTSNSYTIDFTTNVTRTLIRTK